MHRRPLPRRGEVKGECVAQVGEGFLFCLALAGHVNFDALGNIPVAVPHDAGSECALHNVGCCSSDCAVNRERYHLRSDCDRLGRHNRRSTYDLDEACQSLRNFRGVGIK
jgi:hypothetical protein